MAAVQKDGNDKESMWADLENMDDYATNRKESRASNTKAMTWKIEDHQLANDCPYSFNRTQRVFPTYHDATRYINDKFSVPRKIDLVVTIDTMISEEINLPHSFYLPRFLFDIYSDIGRSDSLAKTHQPLNTFTCFGQLPIELRFQIWELTLPSSRLIKLAQTGSNWEWEPQCHLLSSQGPGQFRVDRFSAVSRVRRGWETTSKTPITLQICQESREFALKSYFPLFHGSPDLSPLYFSPSRDVFYIEVHTACITLEILQNMVAFGNQGQLGGIKSICLSANFWQFAFGRLRSNSDVELYHILQCLEGVGEIIIKFPAASKQKAQKRQVAMLLHHLKTPGMTIEEYYDMETMAWLAYYRHNFRLMRSLHHLTDLREENIKILRDGTIHDCKPGYETLPDYWSLD